MFHDTPIASSFQANPSDQSDIRMLLFHSGLKPLNAVLVLRLSSGHGRAAHQTQPDTTEDVHDPDKFELRVARNAACGSRTMQNHIWVAHLSSVWTE